MFWTAGSVLHKVQWTIGQIFKQICNDYIAYIQKCYSPDVTIVFDGGYESFNERYNAHTEVKWIPWEKNKS